MKRTGTVHHWLLGSVLSLSGLAPADEAAVHEATLRAARVRTDDAGLLDVFRRCTVSQAERKRLEGLVRQLGSDSYDERGRATRDLVAAGRRALPLLRAALASPDAEVRRRARWCLRDVEAKPEAELVLAAAALLARRRPAGAAQTLLAYLPDAEDEGIVAELLGAVRAVGWRGGKLEPALQGAVKARMPLQRAAAAYALGRSARAEERDRAVPLLADVDDRVRWRAAEALVVGRDRRGVPALLALLENGSLERAAEAEDLLGRIAGEKAPPEALSDDAGQRRRCRQAWEKWWREQGEKQGLAGLALQGRVLGIRMVAAHGRVRGGGRVWEYGPGHRTLREVQVDGPLDLRVLSGGRLLIAEYDGRRVTERDRSGKVVWEHPLKGGPLEVQKLPSGNVLIVTNYEIVEVNRSHKVTATHIRDAGGNLFSGQVLPGGNLLYGLYTGVVIEQDPGGKQVRRFEIERPVGLANIVALPGGRYLIPYARGNRVVEVDGTGRVRREVSVASPTCVAPLPGGNLLVGSHILNSVREVDRKGNVLWGQKAPGQVFRVRVR